MSAAPLFFTFFIYVSQLWVPTSAPYYKGYTNIKIAARIKSLARELVLDIMAQVKAVQHFRDQYHKSLQYQLGDQVFQMRYIFKRMVRLFQATDKRLAYGKYDHNENINGWLHINRWGLEIQGKVLMIQSWQKKTETLEQKRLRMNSPLRAGPNRDDDGALRNEPFYDLVVRERMAERAAEARGAARGGAARGGAARGGAARGAETRGGASRGPPASPATARKKKNNKWQWRHVKDSDFAP